MGASTGVSGVVLCRGVVLVKVCASNVLAHNAHHSSSCVTYSCTARSRQIQHTSQLHVVITYTLAVLVFVLLLLLLLLRIMSHAAGRHTVLTAAAPAAACRR
jgi:NADH:ubiquinone oxidoreductase subunit 3 (subunit A)